MLSSGLSSEPPSASFLQAIDNLTFVTQHLRDGKTRHTEKFSGELGMKKDTFCNSTRETPAAVLLLWVKTQHHLQDYTFSDL